MRVLIACEESQAVTIAFREHGHEAFSCDVKDCSGGHPEWHIKDDVLKHLNDGWDMMIAHPPCTHLASSGAAWFEKKKKDGRQQGAIDFFIEFTKTSIPKWAIENPVGIMSTIYGRPTQKIQPYSFGDPFQKTTCLWLHGLPKLMPTHMDAPLFGMTVDKGEFVEFESGRRMNKWYADTWNLSKEDRSTARSKTFPGIARAMATQWR